MRFSDWTTFDKLRSDAPTEGGLFQLKVKGGLLTYPDGKSAMFYYGFAGNLNQGLQNFRQKILPLLEVNEEMLYLRWLATEDREARFQNHLNSFHSQFGTLPLGNEMLLQKQSQQEKRDS
ncbi:hypothetical protein GWO43_12220 [candidate division KSB1 bacterium]|nr:hypothetical protein [candidate division KSB1 bacterium]NIR70983.1 hypothetical protein [candidate division KSB1 bacterium]NIS24724.1 hypothetical protein [candidate division KSB1 bacterium]NIT71628.1 hypothetical protein [candidate division KSB1 bacterium]NIU25335.1 hypothetical protein [candidate division KSB1 bacterium]